MGGAQQIAVRLKEIHHFPMREGERKWLQARAQELMHLIKGVVLREAQVTHQNHYI
jgi:hypothetical protein